MELKEQESIPNEYKECSGVSIIMIRNILYRIAKGYIIARNDLDIEEYDLNDGTVLNNLITNYKNTDGASLRYYTDCIILHSNANIKKQNITDKDRIDIIISTCPELDYSVDDKGLLSIGFRSSEQKFLLFK